MWIETEENSLVNTDDLREIKIVPSSNAAYPYVVYGYFISTDKSVKIKSFVDETMVVAYMNDLRGKANQ